MIDDPMFEREVGIVNELGLHARAAAQFVSRAKAFEAHVELARDALRVDGKSILGVLMLGATCGTRIKIVTRGPGAEEALAALCDLVESGFEREAG